MHGGVANQHNQDNHGDQMKADIRQAACLDIACGQAARTVGSYAGAQVRSTERTGQNLIMDLRELPSKQALGLRSEVAMQAR